jgi:TolB-like protein
MDELLDALMKGRERRVHRRALIALCALGALAAVFLPLGLRLGARAPETAARATTPAAGRSAIAVLSLRNLKAQPEKSWLSSALAEMLSTELASSRQLRVIPGENVAVALNELGLAGANAPGREALPKIGKNLGADLILTGSFAVLGAGEQLRLDLRLEDARSGEAVANVAAVGGEAKLSELVGRAGARLRRELGVGPSEPDPAVHASFPANPEAARLLSEGLARLRGFEPTAAKESLERAAKVAPTNPRILAALAAAYSELGQDELARDANRRAFEAAEGLPRDERLSIEGLYRRANKDRQRAVEIGRALVTFFPDDIEYRLRLGYDELIASDKAGVIATLEALRRLPAPASTDPRIDLLESEAQIQLGNIERSREMAARAVVAGRASGARRVVALGRYHEAAALRQLGDQTGAALALREAEELFHQIGDRRYEARAAGMMASLSKK